jgi:FkbM family methyltransferase
MWAGLYETHVGKVFSPKAGQTVIDVGAHIGYYTVQCARLIGEQGTVIAIEPDPRNFALLMRNLRLNKLSNVIALNMALGAINGVIPFLLSDDPANSRCGEGFIYKVKIQRLDDVLMELGINDVDWIKIDIEGYETEVIRGAINTFKSNKKLRLIMEVHQIDILPFMQELGFTYKQLSYNPFSRFGNYYFEKV